MKYLVAFLLLCSTAFGTEVADHLQSISVTISTQYSQGSGVLVARGDQTFVWTAAHVIDDLRTTREIIQNGGKRTVVEFADAKVIKLLVEDGRTVGRVTFDAEVIRYSDADNGEDLALLRVRKKGFATEGATFYLEDKIPPIGTNLFHVGSLLGVMGSNSMTSGIMSQHGRLIGKTVFDQTTATAFPGSSGGGMYLTDGRYMGCLVRGAGEGFNLIVPVRRMRKWASEAGVLWALDPAVPVPSEAELKKLPIEDNGVIFSADKADKKNFFLYTENEEAPE